MELKDVAVSATHGFEITGRDLRIAPPYAVVADGATQPLIVIERFSFHISFLGLFVKPTRVGKVYVTGMTIHIPPNEQREQSLWGSQDSKSEIKFAVSEIICENSHLIIGTANPAKDPKVFDLRHIELHEVGPDAPLRYEALLTNAIPRGDIRAKGTFGPWQAKNPGDSQLTGHYTFDHADLNTIKGIGGMLSSEGDFQRKIKSDRGKRLDGDAGFSARYGEPSTSPAHRLSSNRRWNDGRHLSGTHRGKASKLRVCDFR